MAIKSVCPECETVYQLVDSQAGKKVRCKKCDTVFTVEAPSRPTAVRSDGPSSQARAKSSTMMARREDGEDESGQLRLGPVRSVEKKSSLPLILVSAVVGMGLLLILSGAAITYLLMRDNSTEVAKATTPPPPQPAAVQQPPPIPPAGRPPVIQPAPQADNQPVQPQLVQPDKPAPAKTADPPDVRAQGELKKEDKEENNGRLTEDRRMRVRRATVYLRVKLPDGSMATGSGFFGCKEARNIVLTNAHVVGMLSPESPRPVSVEVIVNSGEANEWKINARILGVDRASDLAVLDIGTSPHPLPEPLTVKPAGRLHELDDVYVFGFPHGEMLGKEISMRKASVSSFRRKNGSLERVQVEGGMDHGNSGGPVVDNSGSVVGVAVAVWSTNKQIGLAIPGERVDAVLDGRISDLTVHQSYYLPDNKVAVPVVMDMIDPRNLVKEVGLELWTGDKPADDKAGTRPATTAQPAKQTGDSPHAYYKLKYMAPEGKAEIVLPELPPGKVYWKQPCWIDGKGQKHWAAADAMTTLAHPVQRNPANLVLRYTQGAKRTLDLSFDNIFKVSGTDDADAFHIRTAATLTESVTSTGSGGTWLKLRYKYPPNSDLLMPDGRSMPNGKLEEVKSDLPRLIASVMQLDRLGNITQLAIEATPPLRQLIQTKPKQAEAARQFHEMIQQGLAALSISLPAAGSIKPLESWKAERPLPIDMPGRTEAAKLDVSFTYLGTRRRDGREEAVISMDGAVRGKGDSFGGRASGQFMVDLASGQTILADATMKLQLKALVPTPDGQPRELRLLLTMKFRMQRRM
jgi:predicted Zn finger-like uncharacterized protein